MTRRRQLFGALALLLAVALSGCAGPVDPTRSRSTPTFRTPIAWGGQSDTNVALTDSRHANLVDFPEGATIHSKSGICFGGDGSKTYTGRATWRVVDGYDLSVHFGKWTVPLESGHSLAGQQDWTELKIIGCSGHEVEFWGVISGHAGGTDVAND